jgi:hypothetical protein
VCGAADVVLVRCCLLWLFSVSACTVDVFAAAVVLCQVTYDMESACYIVKQQSDIAAASTSHLTKYYLTYLCEQHDMVAACGKLAAGIPTIAQHQQHQRNTSTQL